MILFTRMIKRLKKINLTKTMIKHFQDFWKEAGINFYFLKVFIVFGLFVEV